MGKAKETWAEKELKSLTASLVLEHEHWEKELLYGCNDPFCPDGANMNLTRNNILYYRREIKELCDNAGLRLPDEWYQPAPPEVDNGYMARLDQERRMETLRQLGMQISTDKPTVNNQLTIF